MLQSLSNKSWIHVTLDIDPSISRFQLRACNYWLHSTWNLPDRFSRRKIYIDSSPSPESIHLTLRSPNDYKNCLQLSCNRRTRVEKSFYEHPSIHTEEVYLRMKWNRVCSSRYTPCRTEPRQCARKGTCDNTLHAHRAGTKYRYRLRSNEVFCF